jgi:hypothetical protein
MATWVDPLAADHVTGLELQIDESTGRRERARREGWMDDVHAAELEIVALELELASLVGQTARDPPFRPVVIRGAGTAGRVAAQSKTA